MTQTFASIRSWTGLVFAFTAVCAAYVMAKRLQAVDPLWDAWWARLVLAVFVALPGWAFLRVVRRQLWDK